MKSLIIEAVTMIAFVALMGFFASGLPQKASDPVSPDHGRLFAEAGR